MSEQKKYDKIEDAIIELLEGELQENALKFAAYLNENQLTPNMSEWGYIPFNGYRLGWMQVEGKDKWLLEIFNFLKFDEFNDDDEEFTKVVHHHVRFCDDSHGGCWGAKDVKIFGKEFTNVCSQHSRAFVNPDSNTIEHIKKLIEYSKKTKPYKQQYHSNP